MKIHILSVLAIFAWSTLISATTLTPEDALSRALGDVPQKMRADCGKFRLAFKKDIENDPALYVFDTADSGFIVVSARDNAVAGLGYGYGALCDSAGNYAPQFSYWLDVMARRVASAPEAENALRVISRERPARTPIAPQCATKWNQSEPFNNFCPVDAGGRAVTGCVATAMAQAMKYHNWPQRGLGTVINGSSKLNLSQTTFDWNNMLDDYYYGYTSTEADAVALLMQACGYSVNMNYSSHASGAQSINIGTALITNFRYDRGMQYLLRDNYTLSEWETYIYNSLQENGPVIYCGQSYDGGHAFVCDGYDGNGYFHFNWGWGGMSDGFFLLDALDPINQGIGGASAGFDFMQDAIIGMKPNRVGSSSKAYPMLVSPGNLLLAMATSDEDGSDIIRMNNFIYNPGPNKFPSGGEAGLCFATIDPEGNIIGEPLNYAFATEEIPTGYGYSSVDFPMPELDQAATYKVWMIYSADGEEYERIPNPVYCYSDYLLKFESGWKITPVGVAVPILTDASCPDQMIYKDSKLNMNGTLETGSDKECLYFLHAVLLNRNRDEIEAEGHIVPFDLTPGEPVDMAYSSSWEADRLPKNAYRMAMVAEVADNNIILNEPIKVYFNNTSGIDSTRIDNAAEGVCEYFTLDGIKAGECRAGLVPNLEPGIYLEKDENGHIEKVLVK
ncbi:MAG: C10 family peptidase [Candidatus Amulumruptor caecigallinarius]|nr:C10 family peptidase [Candidatus Amulumruptor caecigallinarius]